MIWLASFDPRKQIAGTERCRKESERGGVRKHMDQACGPERLGVDRNVGTEGLGERTLGRLRLLAIIRWEALVNPLIPPLGPQ